MRSGQLRHRIDIQQKFVTRDAVGGESIVWQDFAAAIPAAVTPISGKDFIAIKSAQSEISIKFRIRYLSGINSAMRVSWLGNFYRIIGEPINMFARNRELDLMCSGPAQDT